MYLKTLGLRFHLNILILFYFFFRIKLAEKGKPPTMRELVENYESRRTKQNSTVILEQNCAIKVCKAFLFLLIVIQFFCNNAFKMII